MINLFWKAILLAAVAVVHGLQPICTHNIWGGCVRYVQGFDITGVTTEVDLTREKNGIKSECDCLQHCINNKQKCASWVSFFQSSSFINYVLTLKIFVGVEIHDGSALSHLHALFKLQSSAQCDHRIQCQ